MLTQSDQITIQYDLPAKVEAPIRRGDIIGYEKYAVSGTVIQSLPLTAYSDVTPVSWGYYFHKLELLFCAGEGTAS